MELLKIITEEEIYPELKTSRASANKFRRAVRAVVFDGGSKVALINVSKHNYYKLPGGGIDANETMEDALKRECSEEIGCNVAIGSEIGRIIEHRDKIETDQESDCYLAKLVGKKGKTNLVGYEITDGFEPVWVDIDEAIKLVENSKPDTYDGPFIKIRDLIFLRKAKDLLKK
ncbi:MAG: NUDIX domain-containing protein [Candidatus Staskawiczbacteria bacterium]|nr:NUDIX domain-containing protein [Candidatus Staskawiczbacteria bacterium]